jgi:heptosyltransferase-2
MGRLTIGSGRDGAGAHVAGVQTSFLGDVVLTTPLVAALRAALRPARLSVVVRPDAAPLLAHHPCIDEVVVDDKRGADRGLGGALRVARRLRARRIDVAVSPHRSLRTALVLAAAGIGLRVGFRESRGASLYHVRVPRDRSRHDVERNLALLSAFGILPDAHLQPPYLAPGAAADDEAARLLRKLGLDDGRALYAICPGSVWHTKRWSAEGFGSVARSLGASPGAAVLLLGGSADVAVGQRVERHANGAAVNLVGKTDLATFVALAGRMRAVIANDSAPMHIAAARGVPVVAIFCATTPAQGYMPYAAAAEVVGADLECRPCARHGGRSCPRGTEDCRRLVTPQQVLAAVHRVAACAV